MKKHIKRRYIWYFNDPPRVRIFIPYNWMRASLRFAAVLGFVGLVGLGVYLVLPDTLVGSWWNQAQLAVEALTGDDADPMDEAEGAAMGGPPSFEQAPLAAGESEPELDAAEQEYHTALVLPDADPDRPRAATEPGEEAALRPPVYLQRDPAQSTGAGGAGPIDSVLDPLDRLIARQYAAEPSTPAQPAGPASDLTAPPDPSPQAIAAIPMQRAAPTRVPTFRPARAARPASGVGEITVASLLPEISVAVDGRLITEAPTTLELPWPATYEVVFHRGDEEVYATQVYLTAEHHELSFDVDPLVLRPY